MSVVIIFFFFFSSRRRHTRYWRDGSSDVCSSDLSAADVAEGRAETTAVRQAIARLPRRQRQVLVLRYYLDLSEGEIADALRISRGAVKGYAARGLGALESAVAAGEGR